MKKITLLVALLATTLSMLSQPIITKPVFQGFVVSTEGSDGDGIYIADSFTTVSNHNLEMIVVPGFNNNTQFIESNVLGVNVLIYADQGGSPGTGNHPQNPGTAVWEFTNIQSDNYSIIEGGGANPGEGPSIFTVDLLGANGGEPIPLSPGTYWLSFFPTVVGSPIEVNQWDWQESLAFSPLNAIAIDPTDTLAFDITDWTEVDELNPEVVSFAWTLFGETSLSVADHSILSQSVSVSPNPTDGDLNINFTQDIGALTINIVNVNGQKVLTTSMQGVGSNTIATNELANGVYFAHIISNEGSTTVKFIKN